MNARAGLLRWLKIARIGIHPKRCYPGGMRKAEKVARISAILDELYPSPEAPLDHRDPFTLLVAVALSAQTTDKKVNEGTPALFELAPTPDAMAALEVPVILAL